MAKQRELEERQIDEISKQTGEMADKRKLELEPRPKAGLSTIGGPNFALMFVNIGGGIAHNVHAKYWIEGVDDSHQEWGTQVHFPEDMYKIGIPIDNIKLSGTGDQIRSALQNKDDTFVIEWEYEDAAGKQHEKERNSRSSKN